MGEREEGVISRESFLWFCKLPRLVVYAYIRTSGRALVWDCGGVEPVYHSHLWVCLIDWVGQQVMTHLQGLRPSVAKCDGCSTIKGWRLVMFSVRPW